MPGLSTLKGYRTFLQDAIRFLSNEADVNETAWVIGGSQIYESAMRSDLLHRIYLTEISTAFDCDTFFPKFNSADFRLVVDEKVPTEEQKEGEVIYAIKVYEKIRD